MEILKRVVLLLNLEVLELVVLAQFHIDVHLTNTQESQLVQLELLEAQLLLAQTVLLEATVKAESQIPVLPTSGQPLELHLALPAHTVKFVPTGLDLHPVHLVNTSVPIPVPTVQQDPFAQI